MGLYVCGWVHCYTIHDEGSWKLLRRVYALRVSLANVINIKHKLLLCVILYCCLQTSLAPPLFDSHGPPALHLATLLLPLGSVSGVPDGAVAIQLGGGGAEGN